MSNAINNLSRLNDILFDELNKLTECNKSEATQEIERSKALTNVANTIIANYHEVLETAKFADHQYGRTITIGDATAKLLDFKAVDGKD